MALQHLRAERDRWFNNLDIRKKEERLFELELYLKALDRFCNVRNHPIPEGTNLYGRDFKAEMQIIRDALTRILKYVRMLLPEKQSSAFHFQTFVEQRLLSDRVRIDWIERSMIQNTPTESLYVLENAMESIREIVTSLLGLKKVSHSLFESIGHMISREIAWNTYFNPSHLSDFSPSHDRIRNATIRDVVRKNIPSKLKREISIVFLVVFRLLRYLAHIKEDVKGIRKLKGNLLIFTLIHSELLDLIDYLERDLLNALKSKASEDGFMKDAEQLMDVLAFQITMELRKVYRFELKDAGADTDINRLRTGIARSKGVLIDIMRQIAVQMTCAIDPEIKGSQVFRDYISRTELSRKLRKDIWIFHKVIENLEQTIKETTPSTSKPIIEAMKSLRNYIFYFQNVSFSMVRYTDRESFQDFFQLIDRFELEGVYDEKKLKELHIEIHAFRMYIETTLNNLSMRQELKDQPFGTREGEAILEQFLD